MPCRFIKWTQDAFKAGGSKSELLPLLERCTRELQGDERYRDDARYLRVWIQYVRLTSTALLVLLCLCPTAALLRLTWCAG